MSALPHVHSAEDITAARATIDGALAGNVLDQRIIAEAMQSSEETASLFRDAIDAKLFESFGPEEEPEASA